MRTKRYLAVLMGLAVAGAMVSPPAFAGESLPWLELRPVAGWAVLPDSVTGGLVGADVAYRLAPHWALGLDGALYAPFNGSVGSNPSYPRNETSWSASVDVGYLPWVVLPEAGSLDGYGLLGAGVVSSRPVAVRDPTDRRFDDSHLVQLTAGVGGRMYISTGVALSLELRGMVYYQALENPEIPSGSTALPITNPNNPKNPDTWYSTARAFTGCVELRLGVSFLLGGG